MKQLPFKETIQQAIALLNISTYDSESLNYKRDEIVSNLKELIK